MIFKAIKNFKSLKTLAFGKRMDLTDADLTEVHKAVDIFIKSLLEADLNFTPKMHWIHRHLAAFMRKHRRSLGLYNENWSEALHQYFSVILGHFKNPKLPTNRQKAMENWNSLRYSLPKAQKTRSKRSRTQSE